MSVSLAVTQGDPNNPAAPDAKAYWEKAFGSFDKEEAGEEGEKKEKGEGRGREERGKATPPKKIDGLGGEAYWTASVSMTLYVLKNDAFISVIVAEELFRLPPSTC